MQFIQPTIKEHVKVQRTYNNAIEHTIDKLGYKQTEWKKLRQIILSTAKQNLPQVEKKKVYKVLSEEVKTIIE